MTADFEISYFDFNLKCGPEVNTEHISELKVEIYLSRQQSRHEI